MNSLLVIDSSYLCHRAFHAQGDLSHEGIKTGVIFGFLKTIGHLKTEFQTDRVAFCFDGHDLLRKSIFSGYKMKRIQHERKADPAKLKARGDLCRQIDDLRLRHLPRIGFENIFCYPGFESDDIMAKLAETEMGEVILITSDADMYQCLSPSVVMYSPQKKKLFTDAWFRETYRVNPIDWSLVKAIAGCGTDGVPGIPGVGVTTALKFIRGDRCAKRELILSQADLVNRNRKLVQLPFAGTPDPVIKEDFVSRKGWDEVCRHLGIGSLMGRPPVFSRRILTD